MDRIIGEVATIASGIIGLAVLAVLVSRNANTTGVISAGSSGLARDIAAATAPLSGSGSYGQLDPFAYGLSGNGLY